MPHFLIFYEKAIDKRTFSLLYCPLSCRAEYGGIAQLARAFGSYPKCPRFESRCRYQGMLHPQHPILGPLVKWLRHRPFTAVTWVRVPYGSPENNLCPEDKGFFSVYSTFWRIPWRKNVKIECSVTSKKEMEIPVAAK